jgi:hypothetical protein
MLLLSRATTSQHTSAYVRMAYVRIHLHTSAYVRIRQHTSAYDTCARHATLLLSRATTALSPFFFLGAPSASASCRCARRRRAAWSLCSCSLLSTETIEAPGNCGSIASQHTSACVSMCQHVSACVSMCQHASADVCIRLHTSAYVSIRQPGCLESIPARRARC